MALQSRLVAMNWHVSGIERTASDRRKVRLSGFVITALLVLVLALPSMVGATNSQPHDLEFTYEPANPNTGTLVYLNASAVDDEGDQLSYWWLFYDNGDQLIGPQVTHQFKQAGDFYVQLCVDDSVIGEDPTPSMLTKIITVTENSPPSVSFVNEPAAPWNMAWQFRSICTDLDLGDIIRLTWIWGDGTVSVTNHDSTGGTFNAFALHTYHLRGTYGVVVWIDDLTGLPDHNVSDDGTVAVGPWFPYPPIITAFSVDNSAPWEGEIVIFSATVVDQDADLCLVTFDFGDDTTETIVQPTSNSTVTVAHSYTSKGVYLATVDATDGSHSPITEGPIIIEVTKAEFSLSLIAGWNLVSIPFVDHGYRSSTLPLAMTDIVIGWNTSSQYYDKTYIFGISPPSRDFALEDSTGYWIYTGAAKTLHLEGDVPTTAQSRTINVPASGGWAFIGFASMKTWHASQIPAMFSGGTISVIYEFANGVWHMFIVGVPPTDFTISPGEGCLIWCTSGTLTYSP